MAAKKKVPEIRFTGFEGEWKETKIGKISDSYSGGTPSVGIKEYYNGDIPFMRSGEINSNSTELTLTEFGLKNSSAKLVNTGDILYALYGATSGEVSRANLKCAINQAILAILPHNGYDSEFLRHWLRKQKQNIISTYLQGGQGNLSGTIVKELNLDIPLLPEQTQIGTYFQNLDNLISLHQRKYDKLQTVKKAMLEKMFPREGADVPEIRFKGFEGKWEKKILGKEVETIGTGKSFFVANNEKSDSNPYAILGSRSIIGYDSEFDYSGDFVLTARVGENAGKLYKHRGQVKITDNTVYIQSKNLDYIFYLLTSFNLQKLSFGTGQPLIKASELSNLRLKFSVESEEQTKIGSFFQNLDTLIAQHQKQLEKLKNLKKACLEKMFV